METTYFTEVHDIVITLEKKLIDLCYIYCLLCLETLTCFLSTVVQMSLATGYHGTRDGACSKLQIDPQLFFFNLC